MKLINTLLATALVAAASSCDSLPTSLPGVPGQGGGNAMLDTVKNQPAMNAIVLPEGAAVGQAWTMSMGGMEQRTAIVAEEDGELVVEQTSFMDPGLREAYLVDPSVDLSEPVEPGEMMRTNVTAAWVGVAGEAPIEREVAAAIEMQEVPGGPAEAVDATTGTESVTAGGRTWNAEWTEIAGSRTWMADGLVLRAVSDGNTTMELIEWATDAEPELDWSGGDA